MKRIFVVVAGLTGAALALAEVPQAERDAAQVELRWDLRIRMRDRVELNGNAYLPRSTRPAACLLNLTPYNLHGRRHRIATWFAANGYAYVLVDSRGRGDSGGTFRAFREARDGYDTVEWLAQQPWCNGKVAMWGYSYMGYAQWATAKERPPHLATIVPTASVFPGVDFPMRSNMPYSYVARWLTIVSGRPAQERTFLDTDFWNARTREHFEQGRAYSLLRDFAGDRAATFSEWAGHPQLDSYWDEYVPSPQQYAALELPVLTITGNYDADQVGALTFYRNHMRYGSAAAKAAHYLVIGPWDHDGTNTPAASFGGMTFGPASVIDTNRLHLDWYNWTMNGGAKPEFLKDRVAYYVAGAEQWRYAATLDAVTAREEPLYLSSQGSADDVFASGSLQKSKADDAAFDRYVYDPRDVSAAATETVDLENWLTDQKEAHARTGKLLVYHSKPFDPSTEISGSFRFSAWLAIDQPDTDFYVSVYEITDDGRSVLLAVDQKRARYRESLRRAELVATREPQLYDFDSFTFVARQVAAGSRLRLVLSPGNSMNNQKNYNSGKTVAEETMRDARPVTVTLFHDAEHPSTLFVPIGQPQSTPTT